MANGKATASFFENGSTTQFEYCFNMYPEVLKLKAEKRCKKPQELIRLDSWYQNELPKLIKARGKDAHMVYDELVQTMKWKQSRGKFYPQLSYLVKVNTPRAVVAETKKAFRKLPNLEQAITALSNLKGVGTTMASALLAAAAPQTAPFMADECLMAIPEIEGIDYTTKEYLNFVQHIQATVERLNAEVGGETPHWSPHRVELALWAHYVANDLSPELLDDMPAPGVINKNGTTLKPTADGVDDEETNPKVLDGEEDTNDGVGVDLDEESLGAVGGRHTATESETEIEPLAKLEAGSNEAAAAVDVKHNAATTAALQDGDSNFVSNDSTSQEPINDDNTTQTTATTTSTEDGHEPMALGAGLGLASDSESNLEAPAAPAAGAATANNLLPQIKKQINNNGQKAPESAAEKASTNTTTANGNGNGNGNAASVDEDDEMDDDLDEEEDEVDEEEDDDEEDEELEAESNSSSNQLRAPPPTTKLLAASTGAQKRTALQCEMEENKAVVVAAGGDGGEPGGGAGVAAESGGGGGGGGGSPELKKLRSE